MMRRKVTLLILSLCLLLTAVPVAQAHEGVPPEPHDLWSSWNWSLPMVLSLEVSLFLYFYGLRRMWRRAGREHGVKGWQAVAFVGGIIALFIALISPLDALGSALFSAHMAQHMILLIVVPLLLVLGAPFVPVLWGLPLSVRQWFGRWQHSFRIHTVWKSLTQPIVILVLHTGVIWLWHIPALYQAALASEIVHIVEHLCFLGVGLAYWWSLLHLKKSLKGAGVLSLFVTMIQGSLLGALLTFSQAAWYPAYDRTVVAWGLTPLQDQQLAGIIMWLPSGIVYLLTALTLLVQLIDSTNVPERNLAA